MSITIESDTSYSESLDQCESKKKCEACDSCFHIFKRKVNPVFKFETPLIVLLS